MLLLFCCSPLLSEHFVFPLFHFSFSPPLPSFITAQEQGLPYGFTALCAPQCTENCAITSNDNRGGDYECWKKSSISYGQCIETLRTTTCDFSKVVWPDGWSTSGGAADLALASIRANPALAWAVDCVCKSDCANYQEIQDWPARTTDTGACAVAASVDKTFEQCIATDPYKTCGDITYPAAWGTTDSGNAQTRIAIVKSNEEVAFAVDCMCKTTCAQYPTFNAYAGVKEGICAEAKKVVDSIVPSSYEKIGDGYCTVDAAGTLTIGFLGGAVVSRKECTDLCTARSECIGVTSTRTNCQLAARNCDALAVSGDWCCRCCRCCRCCWCYSLSHSLSLTF